MTDHTHQLELPRVFIRRMERLREDGDTTADYIADVVGIHLNRDDAATRPVTPTGTTPREKVSVEYADALYEDLQAAYPHQSLEEITVRILAAFFDDLHDDMLGHMQRLHLPAATYNQLTAQASAAGCSIDSMVRRAVCDYIYSERAQDISHDQLHLPARLTADMLTYTGDIKLPGLFIQAVKNALPLHQNLSGPEGINTIFIRAIHLYTQSLPAVRLPAAPTFKPSAADRAATKKLRL